MLALRCSNQIIPNYYYASHFKYFHFPIYRTVSSLVTFSLKLQLQINFFIWVAHIRVGPLWPATCFWTDRELRMVITFLRVVIRTKNTPTSMWLAKATFTEIVCWALVYTDLLYCWPETNGWPDISPAKMGLFGLSRQLQFGVCSQGKPPARPQRQEKEKALIERKRKRAAL